MDPISLLVQGVQWLFTSPAAAGLRFASTVFLNVALGARKIPGLSDLKIQTSSYGATIPRVYGTTVRIAGNVIDKSDLIPIKHKKGQIFGGALIGDIGGVKYFTYDAHLQILFAEGLMIRENGLVRIYGDGKVIFDRDADGATPGVMTPEGALEFRKSNRTQKIMNAVRLYRGEPTQGVDPTIQALHPGETLSAYRHVTTVVIDQIGLTELFGSRVPNLEFEVEPEITALDEIVEDIAATADVTVTTNDLRGTTCRGYVVAKDGSAWDALEPLAATFAFDLVKDGGGFKATRRGGAMRTIIPENHYAVSRPGEKPNTTKALKVPKPTAVPDELTLNYFDPARDYQPSSQRAQRFDVISQNKLSVDVPVVLTADEARQITQRALYEAQARANSIDITLSERYRWLRAGDLVGLYVAGQIEPFRFGTMTRSPNGVIEVEAAYEDVLLYSSNLSGDSGNFPTNSLVDPGDTTIQPIDAAILRNVDNDAGFYLTFAGQSSDWRGAEVLRALGVGSPLTFTEIGSIRAAAVIADCDTTLADGPTDVWDEVNTLTVTLLNSADTLDTVTEDDVLISRANLAWVGGADGQDGEYIHFREATAGSPAGTYVLSGLLRGRFGTEHLTGSHGAGERLVLLNEADVLYRVTDTPANWGIAYTYRADSLPGSLEGADVPITNNGAGLRPLASVHLRGDRNDANGDVLISWTPRTRLQTGTITTPVPVGEETEAYEVDIHAPGSPDTVLRTLTASTPSVNYTAAMLTADGFSPGDLIPVTVYKLSATYGRGLPAEGLV